MSKPLLIRVPTLTDLWHKSCDGLLFAKAEDLAWQAGATTGRADNLLMCKSMEYDFDVGEDLWLTRMRFQKLQRDYLDYDMTEEFMEKVSSKKMDRSLAKRGTVLQLPARIHGVVKHGGRKDNYSWGNCILGWTFRPGIDQPGVLSMHSRTSYISYMGGLDLALAYTLGRKIAEVRGEDVREYGFRWMIDTLQWYSIKSMAYMHAYELIEEIHKKKWDPRQYPSVKITRNSYEFLNRRERENNPPKYGPTHRVWELMFNHRPRPVSLPVDNLSLEVFE